MVNPLTYQQSHGHALDPIVEDRDHPVVLAELWQVVDIHHGGQAGTKDVRICSVQIIVYQKSQTFDNTEVKIVGVNILHQKSYLPPPPFCLISPSIS